MATLGSCCRQSMRRAQGTTLKMLRWHAQQSSSFAGDCANCVGSYREPSNFIQKASKSSSASVVDFPTGSNATSSSSIAESVRDTIKTSILEKAVGNDSKAWTADDLENHEGGINDSVSLLQDSANDFYLDRTTRYWPGLPPHVSVADADPFLLTKGELDSMSQSIREDLLGTDHPVLNKAASYFFGSADGGKKVRPMMVLLLSRALADTMNSTSVASGGAHRNSRDDSIMSSPSSSSPTQSLLSKPLAWQRSDLPQAQRRLAEISEMIHTASLFHDDVIDGADTRRGVSSVHMVFGSKMAILAGDYLLARACIFLARLRNVHVVETMATIIEHLVRGEVMQMRGTSCSTRGMKERMQYYLEKNFYKTGSLMANSCKSAAILGSCPPELVLASYKFGKHVGMAFQLVDDVLDFEGSVSSMGKPALSDLKAGISTAPVLFAAQSFPELEQLMDRKFKNEGDIDRAVELVGASDGIERTKQLARVHAELAMESALEMSDSVYRDALINLAYKVVSRTK